MELGNLDKLGRAAADALRTAGTHVQDALGAFLTGPRLLRLRFVEEADAGTGAEDGAGTGLTAALGHDDLLTTLGAPALMAERFVGTEGIDAPLGGFTFTLDCLSPSVALALDAFLGARVTLSVRQADQTERVWNALIADARQIGSDGGAARYRFTLLPFTLRLSLRRDARVFQDQTTQAIADAVLGATPQAAWRFDVAHPGKTRPVCTQYQESDWDFLARLFAEEGWSTRFEHDATTHTLVVFDAAASLALPYGSPPRVRFHRADATERSDTITALSLESAWQPGLATVAGWDPARLLAPSASSTGAAPFTNAPALEWYAGSQTGVLGRFGADGPAHAERQAIAAQQAFDAGQRRIDGGGTVRGLAAGTRLAVTAYNDARTSLAPDLDLTVLSVQHAAVNNLGPTLARALAPGGVLHGPLGAVLGLGLDAAGGAGDSDDGSDATTIEHGTYRNRFLAQPDGVAIAPLPRLKPTAPGMQTALVVGLADTAITSGRAHAVKVQFPWQRGTRPNPGGLFAEDGSSADGSGSATTPQPTRAPGDETAGTWVRVAEALAGPDWGTVFVPRLGTEVLIDFQDGDLDAPVIVGSLYNGVDAPPFPAGVDAAANHPGTLSGWHQPTLDGAAYNQWTLDDATGQLRTRLLSSNGMSSLTLGYLIEQRSSAATGGSQRGSYRGEGFELGTAHWGVIRAGQGLLLSASASGGSLGAFSDVGTGQALEAGAPAAQLKGAAQLAEALAQAAGTQGATASTTAAAFTTLAGQLAAPAEAAAKAFATSNKDAQGRPTPDPIAAAGRFAKPFLIAESPEDLVLSTPTSALLMAGGHLHQLAQGDVHVAALHTYSQVSGQGASFYTHEGGAQLVAASGPMSLQAHTDTLSLLADQDVQVTSSGESIVIQAKTQIVLAAGQSSITLAGGNIDFVCPGTFSVKGAMQAWPEGASNAAELQELPQSNFKPPVTEPKEDKCCPDEIAAKKTLGYFALSGAKNYYETDKDGKAVLKKRPDSRVIGKTFLEWSGGGGTFDIAYDPKKKTITATLLIKFTPMRWVKLDGRGRVQNDAQGNPLEQPYNADQWEKVQALGQPYNRRKHVYREMTRPVNPAYPLSAPGDRVGKVLNAYRYRLTPTKCGKAAECSVEIEFVLKSVTTGRRHADVKLFPTWTRVDSADWGETLVRKNPAFPAASTEEFVTTVIPNHSESHEAGHHFGWPDEYFVNGGALHGYYVNRKTLLIDVKKKEPENGWKRYSVENLMGRGVYSPKPVIPGYYMNHIVKWFSAQTGTKWMVIDLIPPILPDEGLRGVDPNSA